MKYYDSYKTNSGALWFMVEYDGKHSGREIRNGRMEKGEWAIFSSSI